MMQNNLEEIFTDEVLKDLLPPQLSDDFFEAMYGDVNEGAYDISLAFQGYDPQQRILTFELELHERPEKCLACNLTYGLPEVFSCHPLLDIKGMVKKIGSLLGEEATVTGWKLGQTQTPASTMHAIPLTINLA